MNNPTFFSDTWPGMPIVDAPDHWVVPVELTTDDIKNGQTKTPDACAFAQACNRTYGSQKAVFTRMIAYIDLKVGKMEAERLGIEEGTRVVYRFTLPRPTRKAIEQFDMTGTAPTGDFSIVGPSKTMTITYMREQRQKYESAKKAGTAKRRKSVPRSKALTLAGVRYGNGTLKFREATV